MLQGRIREPQSIGGGAGLMALVQLLMPLCASAADKGTELGLASEKWYFEYELKSWAKQVGVLFGCFPPSPVTTRASVAQHTRAAAGRVLVDRPVLCPVGSVWSDPPP